MLGEANYTRDGSRARCPGNTKHMTGAECPGAIYASSRKLLKTNNCAFSHDAGMNLAT